MGIVQRKLSNTFKAFFDSEKSSGVLLIVCTLVSLAFANSVLGENYLSIWQMNVRRFERRALGERRSDGDFLSAHRLGTQARALQRRAVEFEKRAAADFRRSRRHRLPALIHFALNSGTPAQAGVGIPMATDIAFALGVLALLGKRVPASFKGFRRRFRRQLMICAPFSSSPFFTRRSFRSLIWSARLFVWLMLFTAVSRYFKIKSLVFFALGGVLLWFLILKSGIHATIAGVLLAFALPSSEKQDDAESPSYRLEHLLHKPVAFVILPIFALCNTGIVIGADWSVELTSANSLGIIGGLVLGKPLGVTLLSFLAVAIGICRLPLDLNWRHVTGAGILGGIGFTMSIFITNLAFTGDAEMINASKMSILAASLAAGVIGFAWLKIFGAPDPSDPDLDAMDYDLTEA